MQREPLRDRMRGRWHGILPALGVPPQFLTGKHQPCPLCGGKDRARYDDKEGSGSYICSQCGAGDGIALVMKVNGWDFKQAARRIEEVAGDIAPCAARERPDASKQLAAMKRVWAAARPIGSVVQSYLARRGLNADGIRDLRESAKHEMLALVRGMEGGGCQVHRTLLTPEGEKSSVENCRLFMSGQIPKGSAVRLMQPGEALGIAEGIETALSASKIFGVPCWAALNASMLKNWEIPAEISTAIIFADNDANYTGQAAAYDLARRLSSKVSVRVEAPNEIGADWNDVLLRKKVAA